MSKFDPTRQLIMGTFKTVSGFNIPQGTPLFIVETPAKTGEVTEDMARLLWNRKIAVYDDDYRPTPVETDEQARTREAVGALADAGAVVESEDLGGDDLTSELVAPADLVTWQDDDVDLGKKAGDRVTKEDLLTIAFREEVVLTDESTKPVIIRQIVEHRAAQAV